MGIAEDLIKGGVENPSDVAWYRNAPVLSVEIQRRFSASRPSIDISEIFFILFFC